MTFKGTLRKHISLRVLALSVLFVLTMSMSAAADSDSADRDPADYNPGASVTASPDTTRAREVTPPAKSFGQVMAAIPGAILGAPFRVFGWMTSGIVYSVTESPLSRILNLGNPVSPFFVVAGYGSNSGLKAGFGYRTRFTSDDYFRLKSYYSTNNYQSYDLRYRTPHLLGSRLGMAFRARYRKRPSESFHGIGLDTDDDNEGAYTLEQSYLKADLIWSPRSDLVLGLTGGYTATNIFDGEDDSDVGDIDSIQTIFSLTPDHFRATRLLTIGGQITLDRRDNKGQPSAGNLIDLSLSYNRGTGRSDNLEFLKVRADLNQYLNLWRKRILAFRAYFEHHNNIADNNPAPFYLRSSLGGFENLRGYERNRFIDNDVMVISLEYRYPIWQKFDAFVFLDEGRTFGQIREEFTLKRWKYSYGAGLRVWGMEGVVLKTLVALSKEDTHFYFELGGEW